jgi:hypothetical protein
VQPKLLPQVPRYGQSASFPHPNQLHGVTPPRRPSSRPATTSCSATSRASARPAFHQPRRDRAQFRAWGPAPSAD